ncbi:hypothetical protein GJ496_002622 [Pomphorhynchus laevis]|nr:hypothetical protein GJ496_002622 [Pomphorhynchus laevis]
MKIKTSAMKIVIKNKVFNEERYTDIKIFHLIAIIELCIVQFTKHHYIALIPISCLLYYKLTTFIEDVPSASANFCRTILTLIFIIENTCALIALFIIFDVPCLLRFSYTGLLLPIYCRFYINKEYRSHRKGLSVYFIIIRTMWDVPLSVTNYLLNNLFSLRLFHYGYGNYIIPITDLLLIGSYPNANDVPELSKTYNVCAVVNMCDEYIGPLLAYRNYGIQNYRLPTLDGVVPLKTDVDKAVKFIRFQIAVNPGKRILVHSRTGNERPLPVIIKYLVRYENMQQQEALNKVESARKLQGYFENLANTMCS